MHDRWRDLACPHREKARRFFFAEELNVQADVGAVRKGADSLKPPQERGLLGRSHADEVAPTDSIRFNTSRRMKVSGDTVSRSAVHL